ncbi:MAG: hypothetical protein IT384_30865 [Deltaproteobacteria bacterium]|nr:hypothetical protein [Deltaproteobacteria bacterium]
MTRSSSSPAMLKKWNRPLALASLLAPLACSHDLSRELEPGFRNAEARTFLGAADFTNARREYADALRLDPTDSEAAFGWALSDLLLLPDSAPVDDFFTHCSEGSLDVGRDVFGPNGILAQSEATIAGQASISLHEFAAPGAGAINLPFAPDAVRTRIATSGLVGHERRELALAVYERTSGGRWLSLYLNVDDVYRGDADITPLVAGLTIDVSRLDGYIDLFSFSPGDAAGSFANVSPSGTLRVVQVGTNPGDAVELELSRVEIAGFCPRVDQACQASRRIEGTIRDVVSPDLNINEGSIPFADLRSDAGPPARDELVVALDQCDSIDTRYLATQAELIGDLLAEDSRQLGVVLSKADASSFSFTIPARLLHIREDLPINATDVRALKAWVDLASAHVELAAQFQYLQDSLQSQMDEYDWFEPGETTPTRTRGFNPVVLAMHLEAGFLGREADFELDTYRTRLDSGLAAAVAALRGPAEAPGILDLQALPIRRLTGELADTIEAARVSITSATPVPIPSAPTYGFHLKAFFDAPLDRDRLKALSGLATLWSSTPGDAAQALNPSLVFDPFDRIANYEDWTGKYEGLTLLDAWTGGVIQMPDDISDRRCDDPTMCDGGFTCGGTGRCALEPPWFATEAAWRDASRNDWPIFVNTAMRDAFSLE